MNIAATGSLELAQARIGARWGERPSDALWRRIDSTRELAGVLEFARANRALARWVDGVAPDAGLHRIERHLRCRWRERVVEIGGWMPAVWQDAVAWCALLIDLPLLQHLARGQPAPAWMQDDPALRACCEGRPARDPRRTLLDAARADPDHLFAHWRGRWLARCPRGPGRERVAHQLLPLLEGHATAFAAPQNVDGWAAREDLRARLSLLLRRALGEPLMAFVYLAASALELERLRAELVQRVAFPARAALR